MVQRIMTIVCVILLGATLNAQHLVGYWTNWSGANYLSLDQVNPLYDVVNVSFAVPVSGSTYQMTFTPCCGDTPASFRTKIQTLQAAGHIVNISIGGGGTTVILHNTTERDVFVSTMNTILQYYGFDGIDIDIEASLSVTNGSSILNPTDANIIHIIDAIEQLQTDYSAFFGKDMFLGMAPETANCVGGQSNYAGTWGSYLPLIEAFRDDLDVVHPQIYNSGSMYALGGAIYDVGTPDFLISQIEKMIQGFPVPSSLEGSFTGLPANKVGVGLPACNYDIYSGYMSVADVAASIKYLMGNGPKPGAYTLVGGPYPDLGGMMTWALNYDHYNVCNDNTLEFAHNYEALFLSGCERPDLGADINVCVSNLPLQLQSNTTTGTGVVFTWINTSTSDTLIRNDPNATNATINTSGIYKVIRTSDICVRFDEIIVAEMLDVPQLSGATSLCQESPLTIQVTNTASYDLDADWQWYKDGQTITSANATTLANIMEDGLYSVSVNWGTCQKEGQHQVTSDLPVSSNACVGSGEQAMLGITNTDPLVTYDWYDAAQGGNLVNTGVAYTTPTLTQTTIYYVQSSAGAGTSTIGLPVSGNGLGTLTNTNYSNIMTFDVHTAFTLKEMTVFPLIYGYSHPFNIEVRDAQGNLVPGGSQPFTIQHPGSCCVLMGQYRLVFAGNGIELAPGNGYTFNVTSDVKNDSWSGNVSYPLQYGSYVTFTQSEQAGWFQALHDWLIEIEGCVHRVPVTAEVDPACFSLPVTWLSVEAIPKESEVEVVWETVDEYNTSHFEIERMDEDWVFQAIGQVEAAGNSGTIQRYIFTDKHPMEGSSIYRIRQFDTDGSFTYSKIVQVMWEGTGSYEIRPNPVLAGQPLNVLFPTEIRNGTKLSLYDMLGHKVGEWSLEAGLKNFPIPISNIQAGSYIFHLTSNTEHVSQIIVVQ